MKWLRERPVDVREMDEGRAYWGRYGGDGEDAGGGMVGFPPPPPPPPATTTTTTTTTMLPTDGGREMMDVNGVAVMRQDDAEVEAEGF